MIKITFSLFFLGLTSLIFSQDYDFTRSWENLGPYVKPLEDSRQSANGIGPIEFIRVNQKVKGHMLSGSLNGGLFSSTDGGNSWINSGSDDWDYSGCGWAEYHPGDEKIWFASSVLLNDNGSPGPIGFQGGIYRTTNAGLNWELTADYTSFSNSEYLVIHGMKFHPNKPDELFVFTSDGLYRTKNCLADKVQWERIFPDVGGWIYDLTFLHGTMYFSQMQFGKWAVKSIDLTTINKQPKMVTVYETDEPLLSLTLEPNETRMLMLINYLKKGDELLSFDLSNDSTAVLLKNQNVVFGRGRTLASCPTNKDEIMIGNSTGIDRWNLFFLKKLPFRASFHVDIEFMAYDPFDSLKMYLATHGGIYMSENRGQAWESASVGLGVAEVEGIAVSEQDPNQIAIGCFHDGSTIRADFTKNGLYEWKNINGGDGLLPLQPANNPSVVYTSNQYTGGGIYYSNDTGRTKINLHTVRGLSTSGWQMAAVLHPVKDDWIFFNYQQRQDPGKGNIDVCRTNEPNNKESMDRITDFQVSHKIDRYSIFGIYNSEARPDELYVHMIHMTVDEEGVPVNVHRLFKTDNCMGEKEQVINSWFELEIPRNDWIADVTPHPTASNRIYLTYVSGKFGSELSDGEYGMIYHLKYKKHKLKREMDISQNLPFSFTGRYNVVTDGNGGLFIGTRTGVYYGNKKLAKGKGEWTKVGFGPPHCKVHGLYYHKKTNSLTIGYYGRGVWRYYL